MQNYVAQIVTYIFNHRCSITNNPKPEEKDIEWLIKEAQRYLNPEISLERKHVMSAWCGIRPLAQDPNTVATGNIFLDFPAILKLL